MRLKLEINDLWQQMLCPHMSPMKKGYLLEIEMENDEDAEPIRLDYFSAENLASFCRAYLLTWEFAQKVKE